MFQHGFCFFLWQETSRHFSSVKNRLGEQELIRGYQLVVKIRELFIISAGSMTEGAIARVAFVNTETLQ